MRSPRLRAASGAEAGPPPAAAAAAAAADAATASEPLLRTRYPFPQRRRPSRLVSPDGHHAHTAIASPPPAVKRLSRLGAAVLVVAMAILVAAQRWLSWHARAHLQDTLEPTTAEKLRAVPCGAAAALSNAHWLPWLPAAAAKACQQLSPPVDAVYPRFASDLAAWREAAMPAFWGTALRTALLAIPLGRYVLDLGFQALGRRWLPLAGALGVTPSSAAVTFTKWREACWRMATYCFLTALGAATCAGEPWIRDTRLLWAGWPLGQHHSPMLQFWYAVEFGLYLYCVADLLLWEASRGDYWAMLLHHAASLSLLLGSFCYGFLRVGAIILMINDFVDLWFEGAKLAKYAQRENISTAFFLAFVASWAWLRQVYCPLYMIRSMLMDAWDLVALYGPTPRHVGIYAGFNALVVVLQLLHSYWFFFLLQKIKLTVSISVSVKVVDRRPGAEVEPRAAQLVPASPSGLQMNTARTLLEEE